ncbi:hypothetical protein HOU47_gp62 [Arthrobacter phage Constance]|uniref:Uncharacterized protein n=1 Tax=Arthrobacter phage Constance TaxID=2419950 RepID=A0A3G2KEQ2_9CAUD|nr:hypothetical protein HOU47_gp62 [Arthrobacter phage Constance]AYN57468.1 hypothetical protein PBI_CONSTANCE_62 [Arthrobacter phage Constance]
MANQTSNVTPEQLNDPEGQRLVAAIHERQERREELGRIIWTTSHRDEGTISATGANILADAILAAGYRKPHQITTADELLALPEESVVLDAEGDVSQKRDGLWCGYDTAAINSNKLARLGSPFIVLQVGSAK